jgi:hypothetical protein
VLGNHFRSSRTLLLDIAQENIGGLLIEERVVLREELFNELAPLCTCRLSKRGSGG